VDPLKRILIVEDEAVVRLHLVQIVKRLGYVVVGTAPSADAAVALADSERPDLILMDVQLQGERDGIDAATEISQRHDTGIVFLTAFADEKTVARTQTAGALGYIVKPFSEEDLRAGIATAMTAVARIRSLKRFGPAAEVKADDVTASASRVMIYSHDTFGLGHLRRSLNLAGALVERFSDLSVLIVTGSAVAHRFPFPERVDYVKLPAVRKVSSERYEARSLNMPDDSIAHLRANILLRTVQDFDPGIVLVDHSPVGMRGELRPTLEWLNSRRPDCVKILGLRDVLDAPELVQANWEKEGIYDVLNESYDHILVYGMQSVFDPVDAYAFPASLRERTNFVNYVVEDIEVPDDVQQSETPNVLVTIGGGDGGGREVIGTCIDMVKRYAGEMTFRVRVLPGPFIDPVLLDEFHEAAKGLPIDMVGFVESSVDEMHRADVVVCTGGYNTTMQALRYGKSVLVIPRVMHRREQQMRATFFCDRGVLDTVHPDEVGADSLYEKITTLLGEEVRASQIDKRRALEFDGAARFGDFIGKHILLGLQPQEATNE